MHRGLLARPFPRTLFAEPQVRIRIETEPFETLVPAVVAAVLQLAVEEMIGVSLDHAQRTANRPLKLVRPVEIVVRVRRSSAVSVYKLSLAAASSTEQRFVARSQNDCVIETAARNPVPPRHPSQPRRVTSRFE